MDKTGIGTGPSLGKSISLTSVSFHHIYRHAVFTRRTNGLNVRNFKSSNTLPEIRNVEISFINFLALKS